MKLLVNVKRALKRMLTKACSTKLTAIIQRGSPYECISFDIFDTLIDRDIQNREIFFRIVGERIARLHSHYPDNFVSRRQSIERSLSRQSYPHEITLHSIYAVLFPDADDKCLAEMCQIEEDVEVAVSVANKAVLDVFQTFVAQNKRVVLTSDMYLREDVLVRILKKNNVVGYERLYLSSRVGLTKRSGFLFTYVASDLRLAPRSIMHIGNDLIADYRKPRIAGFTVALIDRLHERSKLFTSSRNDSKGGTEQIIGDFLKNHESAQASEYEKIGYEVLGPLLCAFSWWLDGVSSKKREDKLLFFAREGILLKKAFTELYPHKNDSVALFRASRRSMIACSLCDVGSISALHESLLPITGLGATLKDIRDLGYASPEAVLKFMRASGSTLDTELVALSEGEWCDQFVGMILPSIRSYAKKQNSCLRTYFNEFIGDAHRVGLVDVGWRGSMQDALKRALDTTGLRLQGYYIGVHDDYRIRGQMLDDKLGALYQDVSCRSEEFYKVSLTGQFFEMLFLGGEGTTLGYTCDGSGIRPCLDICELSPESVGVIETIQESALRFVRDYASSGLYTQGGVVFHMKDAFVRYERFAVYPSAHTIDLFRDFSTKNIDPKPITSMKNGFYWIVHPRQFLHEFEHCYCKIIFLKSAFKIPFPYYRVLRMLKKLTEKRYANDK